MGWRGESLGLTGRKPRPSTPISQIRQRSDTLLAKKHVFPVK